MYLEEDLDNEKMEEMNEHLKCCEECRSKYEEEKEINEMFLEALNDNGIEFESKIDTVMSKIDHDKYKNKVVDIPRKESKGNFFIRNKFTGIAAALVLMIFMGPKFLDRARNMESDYAESTKGAMKYEGSTVSDDMSTYGTVQNKPSTSRSQGKDEDGKTTETTYFNSVKSNTEEESGDKENKEVSKNTSAKPNEEEKSEEKADEVANTASVDNETKEVKEETSKEETDKNDGVTDQNIDEKGNKSDMSEGKPGVQGKDHNKNKLIELLGVEEYLLSNYQISLIDFKYVKLEDKKFDFNIEDITFESYVEDDESVYIVIKATDIKTSKYLNVILKHKKGSSEITDHYRSGVGIKGVNIEDDKLIIDSSTPEKVKIEKIDK